MIFFHRTRDQNIRITPQETPITSSSILFFLKVQFQAKPILPVRVKPNHSLWLYMLCAILGHAFYGYHKKYIFIERRKKKKLKISKLYNNKQIKILFSNRLNLFSKIIAQLMSGLVKSLNVSFTIHQAVARKSCFAWGKFMGGCAIQMTVLLSCFGILTHFAKYISEFYPQI